ncbi:MAG: hypothetical protein QW478_09040 [Candidatus Micrarchaeaceae archaeon]
MVKVKVVLKRRQNSPIIYLSDENQIEKIGMTVNGNFYPIPAIKGSHFRGRFRRWFAKKILQSNLLQIKQEKDYHERFAILTALLYSGSIVKGMAIRDDNMLKAVKDLEAVDKFGKYFGYMITGLANKRSDLSIGFAVPAIKGVNVDDDVNCLAYPVDLVELEYKKAIPIGGGKFLRDITMPLVVILVSRKAGVVDEIIDIIEDEQQLNNVLDFLGTQSSIEKDKKDTNNIFYIEAINTGFDLIQDIIIDSNDEKDITAILTAYKSFFKENPFIGSYATQGYGIIDDIIIDGIQENEEVLDEFIKSINLKEITDIIKFDRAKVDEAKKKKDEKKNKNKELEKESE